MAEGTARWNRVKFGDVVDVVTDYWDRDPTIPKRFLAGEHIDEGELRVRRWGMTNDELVPPTFNRRFRAGDVLFHSRNLKKLARPDFDGVTGEKLFVLRSRDRSRLSPDLLAFLLQTPPFVEYVNRRWAGSTNKFLNKTPLLEYEFALPPLDEQQRLAALLNAHSEVIDRYVDVWETTQSARRSLGKVFFINAPEGERATVGVELPRSSGQSLLCRELG